MTVRSMTQDAIRQAGIAAISEALGPAGLARFLQQFESGVGDYTAERDQILGNPTVGELARELKRGSGRGRKIRRERGDASTTRSMSRVAIRRD